MMGKKLPFEHSYESLDSKDKYQERVKNIGKEKKLTGNDIRNILIKHIKDTNLKFTKERDVGGSYGNPFDLVVGDVEELKLYGFEIKGDTDNFQLLKNQLQAYIFAFEEVYLVLHKKKKPEWLPDGVGVIRVFDNKEVYIEEGGYIHDPLEVSTNYEWDVLFKSNGLGNAKKTIEALEIVKEIRRNILFNRFFAISAGWNSKEFDKYYPFTDKQKTIIVGFDVPYHYKNISRDITKLEKRIDNLKKVCMIGQKALSEFKEAGKKK